MEPLSSGPQIETVLPKILEYFKLKDLVKIRLVSKLWNSIVVESKRLQENGGLCLKVCTIPASLDAFKTLSLSLPVKEFYFDGLNLEEIFGDAETFRRFSINHCLQMTSLRIVNCNLCTGRFFELLAFCKKLTKLVLRNVPSIYKVENGIAVYNWAFCFKSVRENLAKVQSLTLSENGMLSHNDFWGLVVKMTTLKHLHVHVTERSFVPIKGINEYLKINPNLTTLIIRGKILPPGLGQEELKMVNLQKLTLRRSKIDDNTVKQLEAFLAKCPKLEMLRLSHTKIEKTTISSVKENLVDMDLIHCNIDADAFEDAEFKRLKELTVELLPTNGYSTTVDGVQRLLSSSKPQLCKLELKLPSSGADYLKCLNVEQHPKLTTLSLQNCNDIAGRYLRKIFKDFTGLLQLYILNCRELTDENVCPSLESDKQESLENLKNLKTLVLAGTNVGDKTVYECIVRMDKLECINLKDTKVTMEGLEHIISRVKTNMTSLKVVNVNKCKIPWQKMKELIALAPTVNIECPICTKNYGTVDVGSSSD